MSRVYLLMFLAAFFSSQAFANTIRCPNGAAAYGKGCWTGRYEPSERVIFPPFNGRSEQCKKLPRGQGWICNKR